MARKPRIHFPGALYHVMLRGNDKQLIFRGDADKDKLGDLISDGIERFGHRIHAYCWMENHVHLAIQVSDVPLSKIMHNMSLRYTRHFNWRYQHVGHLFQGRYKAPLVNADVYLLQLVRYIHLNPVRAGICRRAEDFHWSSHRVYLGQADCPWLTTSLVLAQFGNIPFDAAARFAQFVSQRDEVQLSVNFKRGNISPDLIGDREFVNNARERQRMAPLRTCFSMQAICTAICAVSGICEAAVLGPSRADPVVAARAALILLVTEQQDQTLTALAIYLGRDISTLSRIAENARLSEDEHPVKVIAHRADVLLHNTTTQS